MNATSPPAKEPIKDGITAHNRRIGDLILDLGNEIAALQRIEKALKDCHERLERHTGLMATEAQLVEALLKRDHSRQPIKAVPTNQLADRVEEDLARLTSAFVNAGTNPNDAPSIDKASIVGVVPKRT